VKILEQFDRASETDEWDDIKDQYAIAQKLSEALIIELHAKINAYLAST